MFIPTRHAWLALLCEIIACGSLHSVDAAQTAAPGEIGAACTDHAGCATQLCADGMTSATGQKLRTAQGLCSLACDTEDGCGPDGVCFGMLGGGHGQCLARCTRQSQCRAGLRCANYQGVAATGFEAQSSALTETSCQVPPETDRLAEATTGAACSRDADCGGGSCMHADEYGSGSLPDGYCSGRCLEDADCGKGGICQGRLSGYAPGALGQAGMCFAPCADDAGCRAGYRCRAFGGAKHCWPGPVPLQTVGNSCESDADCGGAAQSCARGMYAPNLQGMSAPGGYCSQHCGATEDCGPNGICVGASGLPSSAALTGVCLRSCSSQSDCREGYVCNSVCTAKVTPTGGPDAGTP